ncbi:MAG: hypothetical protein HYZ42_15140 [Bacteroidetes bacterium]|nr:hypothetical protein [Bacteroidota bacterium]
MKRTDKIWRLTPTLTLGLFLNYKLIKDADDEFIFDGIVLGSLLIVFLFALLWTNIKDSKEYKQTKSKLSFIPTLSGLLVIVSLIVSNYLLKSRDNSPVLIQAGYDGGFNGAWFDFREDGTYKFANSGGIGATYFRGTYTLKDSMIILDKSNIDIVIKTHNLVIRKIINQDSTTELLLYQINDRYEIVDKQFVFTVNEDNRNK